LKNSATQKKPLSTYISDALSSIISKHEKQPTKEEKYNLQTQTPKISLVREDAPPIVKPKIVDNPVQEQKPKIADIPKTIVDNRKNNAEKPKQKLDSYVGDFDKSKWIYIEAPLDKIPGEYSNDAKEDWRRTREYYFGINHHSFIWSRNSKLYDTFTGKQL